MRQTRLLIPTLREVPAEAEVVSHKLLLRAGMIRQVARGIYDFLPLGVRVLRKVERIIREEMQRAGAQEVLLPAICPAELWQESGRWERYGKELLRMKDRNDREFCFGPTHEEVVTDLVRRDVRSYRDLPLNLFQIQVKFRDEVRPRFGLMRGREFIMKDGYSFHVDRVECDREYDNMYAAYRRIFERCGLRFRPVEADTGAIGGSRSHEFQVLADSGEDAIVSCDRCEYAANVEKAAIGDAASAATAGAGGASCSASSATALRTVATPGQRTVEEVSAFLAVPAERFVKSLVYVVDGGGPVLAMVRGDHVLSEAKLKDALGAQAVALASEDVVARVTGAPVGFAGPIGLPSGVRRVGDRALAGLVDGVAGANAADQHLVGVAHARDLADVELADLRVAGEGDACPRCDGRFVLQRGIEVGQVFHLGTKYSAAMHATVLDADGAERLLEMGCYGIGVTRTIAAAIEQNHDDAGIIWPMPLAPFHVVIVPVNCNDERLRTTAERLHDELEARGIDVLLDDRDERPGVKFKDADLIGHPLRITVGPRALERGAVELKRRTEASADEVPVEAAAARVAALVAEGLGAPPA
ncbi:MAG: proline--tRNA ligase [Deltaproteobacteria bacterium]|nr:proline--tRNA ligase [Deltaproteobacteria bacterium]